MLKIEWWQTGLPNLLRRVFNAGLKVILNVFHEQRLGLARLFVFHPLGIARDI